MAPRPARPFVTVYSEVSADGKTTHRRGASSKPMMAYEDAAIRAYRHRLRAEVGAIMVGSNTVRIDDPLLTVRHVDGPSPLRVVPASGGDLPAGARLLTDGLPTLVAVAESAPAQRVDALRGLGATVVRVGQTRVDLAGLLAHLAGRGVAAVMVEGGATLLASLFALDLVDRLVVQHLPVVFGGDGLPSMVGGPALERPEDGYRLQLTAVERVGGHAVITYARRHASPEGG